MTEQSALIPASSAHPLESLITGRRRDKDRDSRLRQFVAWQFETGMLWHAPDLASYRDYLLDERDLMASTVRVHLATIRSAYQDLLLDLDLRDALYNQVMSQGHNFTTARAVVKEKLERIQIAIDPSKAPVRVKVIQDRADSAHLRLSPAQAMTLINRPGVDTTKGLRDTALIAMLLCTGIREGELIALAVNDLRQTLGGELALHVREGKGAKERLVPYGDMDWCLVLVDAWLKKAEIGQGPVFRGLYKGGKTLRPGPLSRRAVGYILDDYPITINGELRSVKPHDCRRTYARLQYDAGLELTAIQQNLGHSDQKTTLTYIGTLDADKRRARAVFFFDVSQVAS